MTNLPFSEDLPGCLMALLIFALFFGAIAWAFMRERKHQAVRKQILVRLGFIEVANPDVEIFERLERVYRRTAKEKFQLRALFEKYAARGRYYLYDLVETSGEENTYLGENEIAVWSSELNLPRLYILGRVPLTGKTPGWMANAAERVIQWAASQSQLAPYDLAEFPDIAGKLVVMAADPQAARPFLTRDRLQRLTWLADMQQLSGIETDGDFFVLKRQTSGKGRKDEEAHVLSLLKDAEYAWSSLR